VRIFLYLKSLIFKLINKVFGRTAVFIIILGWFLLISGIWMFLQPERAKRSLAGRGFGFAKGCLLILALFLGMLLLSISSRMSGIVSLAILIAGVLLLVRAYILLRRKTSQKISAWVEKMPVKFLKIYAIIQAVIGTAMLLLHKRIWH